MAGLKEIQNRIRSIQDTRKITNAMYMISSTKLKKARADLEATEPYFYTLQAAIDRILRHMPELQNIYFEDPEKPHDKNGILLITGDKGLAGAYNHNVLKKAEEFLEDKSDTEEFYVVGELGRQYYNSRHVPIEQNFRFTAQNPTFDRARWIADTILERYLSGEVNEVHVIYTRMENSMVSVAEDKMLLPLPRPPKLNIPIDVYQEEFFMLPSVEEAIEAIVPNYITGFIYGALVESFCSEQHSRMMAMESATNNADDLLRSLEIMYNRARQAAITQEITEVCSGARAQKQSKKKKEMHV